MIWSLICGWATVVSILPLWVASSRPVTHTSKVGMLIFSVVFIVSLSVALWVLE